MYVHTRDDMETKRRSGDSERWFGAFGLEHFVLSSMFFFQGFFLFYSWTTSEASMEGRVRAQQRAQFSSFQF